MNTEQTETAPETKATKKAAAGARRANVAPTKPKSGKKATPKKKAPRSARNDAREGSKTAMILDLLKRPGGATAKELLKATGWQPHSLRGFLSRDGRQEDGPDRHLHQGRGRGAELLREGPDPICRPVTSRRRALLPAAFFASAPAPTATATSR